MPQLYKFIYKFLYKFTLACNLSIPLGLDNTVLNGKHLTFEFNWSLKRNYGHKNSNIFYWLLTLYLWLGLPRWSTTNFNKLYTETLQVTSGFEDVETRKQTLINVIPAALIFTWVKCKNSRRGQILTNTPHVFHVECRWCLCRNATELFSSQKSLFGIKNNISQMYLIKYICFILELPFERRKKKKKKKKNYKSKTCKQFFKMVVFSKVKASFRFGLKCLIPH